MLTQKQAIKKSGKINFGGLETAVWGGLLPREGVVVENFVPSVESWSPWVSKGAHRDVPGILPGCPGSLEMFTQFSQKFAEGGIGKELSEIDFHICDQFATILRTLSLMHETNYQQFSANLARDLRQICATPPSRTPPSRDF